MIVSIQYKFNCEIFSISVNQEMIIPEWLFELPIIQPERNEFRNSKNEEVINCDSQYEIVFLQPMTFLFVEFV